MKNFRIAQTAFLVSACLYSSPLSAHKVLNNVMKEISLQKTDINIQFPNGEKPRNAVLEYSIEVTFDVFEDGKYTGTDSRVCRFQMEDRRLVRVVHITFKNGSVAHVNRNEIRLPLDHTRIKRNCNDALTQDIDAVYASAFGSRNSWRKEIDEDFPDALKQLQGLGSVAAGVTIADPR